MAPILRDGGRILAVGYFAVALAPRNITVNAICPGITDDSIVNAASSRINPANL